jgi:hypothetical protein
MLKDSDTEPATQTPSRKDLAAKSTRRIVFGALPTGYLSTYYQAVEEVILTGRCLDLAHLNEDYESLRRRMWLLMGTTTSTSTPLHVVLRSGEHDCCSGAMDRLLDFLPPLSLTCDIYFQVGHIGHGVLDQAYNIGAAVYFLKNPDKGYVNDWKGSLASRLCDDLESIFLLADNKPDAPPGKIFLYDLAPLLLSPEELAQGNINDVVRLKLFERCDFDRVWFRKSESEKWDYFVSRVKFVDKGFRPSQADINASAART